MVQSDKLFRPEILNSNTIHLLIQESFIMLSTEMGMGKDYQD